MNAVSTFRPFAESEEYATNQRRAFVTWCNVFDEITWFNDFEIRMAPTADKPLIIWTKQKPLIRSMAKVASYSRDWAALVNADIVILDRFNKVQKMLDDGKAVCAISRRWQFLPDNMAEKPAVVDEGLDFFCARREVWREVADAVPEKFEMGKVLWDSWLLQFFMWHFGEDCYDITNARCILHPKHGGRKDQGIAKPDDFLISQFQWPAKTINMKAK